MEGKGIDDGIQDSTKSSEAGRYVGILDHGHVFRGTVVIIGEIGVVSTQILELSVSTLVARTVDVSDYLIGEVEGI